MHIVIDGIKLRPFIEQSVAERYRDKYCKNGAVRECRSGGYVIQLQDALVDDALASPVGLTKSISDQLFI